MTGIRVSLPDSYKTTQVYDTGLQIVRYGEDNLHPNHLRDLLFCSPTLRCVVDRETDFLLGDHIESNLLRKQEIRAIAEDFSLHNGFSILIHTTSGNIDFAQHIPFENVRLCESGANGITTQCRVVDWTFTSTVNKKRISKNNIITYWLFSRNRDVRLAREQAGDGYSVLYYSLSVGYPVSEADSVLTSISTELGLLNVAYRNVRNSFNPACVVSIPTVSDEDFTAFQNNLKSLQGDTNAQKILLFQTSSEAEAVKVEKLETDNLDTAYQQTSEDVVFRIHQAFNQIGFLRLYQGGLGFANDVIASIYALYEFQIKSKRQEMIDAIRCIDPSFDITPIKFNIDAL